MTAKDNELEIIPKAVEGEVVQPVTTWADVKKSWSEAWAEIKKVVEENKPVDRICKNCKHWDTTSEPVKDLYFKLPTNTCTLIGDTDFQIAWVTGPKWEMATLRTHESFGCNQFEAKE